MAAVVAGNGGRFERDGPTPSVSTTWAAPAGRDRLRGHPRRRPSPALPEPAMSHPNRAGLAIEVRQLPAGATEADWHDGVTALIEADAYWALFPEEVVS